MALALRFVRQLRGVVGVPGARERRAAVLFGGRDVEVCRVRPVERRRGRPPATSSPFPRDESEVAGDVGEDVGVVARQRGGVGHRERHRRLRAAATGDQRTRVVRPRQSRAHLVRRLHEVGVPQHAGRTRIDDRRVRSGRWPRRSASGRPVGGPAPSRTRCARRDRGGAASQRHRRSVAPRPAPLRGAAECRSGPGGARRQRPRHRHQSAVVRHRRSQPRVEDADAVHALCPVQVVGPYDVDIVGGLDRASGAAPSSPPARPGAAGRSRVPPTEASRRSGR